MKKFLSLLLTGALVSALLPSVASAQQLPTVPAAILNGLTGYTSSYIAGGPYGGDILIVGGVRDGRYMTDALLFDPANNVLETPDQGSLHMGAPRAFHTATTLQDGRILLFGGESAPGTYVSVAEIFDPATFNFAPVSVTGKDLPHPQRKRQAASFFYIFGQPDEYVLIAGGCTGACGSAADQVKDSIIYNVKDGSFMAGPLMHQARQDATATYLPAAGEHGVVMLQGGGDPEYFDINSFTKAAGSGQFVQDATTTKIVEDNEVLLGQQNTGLSVFSSLPAAVDTLLAPPPPAATTPAPTQDTDALRKQLADLESFQKSLDAIRAPSSSTLVISSDSRGNIAQSGGVFDGAAQNTAMTGSGQTLADNVARALIMANQDKLASMLRGGATGSGMTLPAMTPEQSYPSDFAVYLASQPEAMALLLKSLPETGRDSDSDGIADHVEIAAGLNPFKADSDGNGASDLDMFIGTLPPANESATWGRLPSYSGLCQNNGAVWGRAEPSQEVGIFQQTGSGQRLLMSRTKADEGGFFLANVTSPADAFSVGLVARTTDAAGVYHYSTVRQQYTSPCDPASVVLLDRITFREGSRVVEGHAQPDSFVFLSLPRRMMVVQTDAKGDFVAQLPTSLQGGEVAIATWSVAQGKAGMLHTYTMQVPLQDTTLAALHGAAEEEGSHPLFWWIYALGILGGCFALGSLAFSLRRRYSQDISIE